MLKIESAEFLASHTSEPPVEVNNAEPHRSLPDDWQGRFPTLDEAWYQFAVELNVAPNRLWAIYLPCISMNAAVYLNGELLGQSGQFKNPVARYWNRPLYYLIPNGLLTPGKNVFHIRLKADPPGSGLLGKVYLGPDADLRSTYIQRHFLKVSMVQFVAIATSVMGLFITILWLLRRTELVYGWFALLTLVWTFHNLYILMVDIPVARAFWDVTWYISLGGLVILTVPFVHSFLGYLRPKIERSLFLYGVSGACGLVWLASMESPWLYPTANAVWNTIALIIGLYPTALLIHANWKHHGFEALWILVSGLLILSFAAHDWLMTNGLLTREEGFFIHYGVPVALAAFGWILLLRFVNALNEAQTLNVELDLRVQQKSLQLQQNYERLRRLERNQVLAEERERIMRDMHDGVGGHLVEALAILDLNKNKPYMIKELLYAALCDLRLMIDSLEPVEGNLPVLLGMFRNRMQPRLKAVNMRMRWEIKDLPAMPHLGPQMALQILRILQEVVTNVIKHAHAQSITLRTGEINNQEGLPCAYVEIIDDGKGFTHLDPNGRGLLYMRRRAARINAQIDFQSSARGTRVTLLLPIEISEDPIAAPNVYT